MEVITEYRSNK